MDRHELGGGLATPVFFFLFDRLNHALGYQPIVESSLRRPRNPPGRNRHVHLRPDPQERRATQLLALLLCLGLAVLLAGLWWVQIVNANRYRETVETQSFRTVRLPAVRGKILDRNGIAFAENRPELQHQPVLEELSSAFKKDFKEFCPPAQSRHQRPALLERLARRLAGPNPIPPA